MMKAIVQKYGGSSVATSEKILSIAQQIKKKIRKGYKLIVVVSAMGKTTDGLIRLAKEITPSPDPRELDMIMTTGEQVSASLLSMGLRSIKCKSKSLNAFQAGIRTTSRFNEAKIKSF